MYHVWGVGVEGGGSGSRYHLNQAVSYQPHVHVKVSLNSSLGCVAYQISLELAGHVV